MDDDDDLWGPPFVVEEDTHRKQTLRGFEFWFDFRTDVLEEFFQNKKYCEKAWRIMNEKKQVAETIELQTDLGSYDSEKTLTATLPDADTSSAKSSLCEDENTSTISDAQTIKTRDSCNDTEVIDQETRLKPKETAANEPVTVKVAKKAYTSSIPLLMAVKTEKAEEHSNSSLVDPIKQAPENKSSSSSISRESSKGSSLRPLQSKTKVRKNTKATSKDEVRNDHQQSDKMQGIVTTSEPFTAESLLERCDESDKGRETRSHPKAVKTVVKAEPDLNLLTEAKQKDPGPVLTKKRRRYQSNTDNNKDMNSSFVRNMKQKVGAKAGEVKVEPIKNTTTDIIIWSSDVPTQHLVNGSVISTSDLKNKTGKELRKLAKSLKITHYYKLKKEDLLERLTTKLNHKTD